MTMQVHACMQICGRLLLHLLLKEHVFTKKAFPFHQKAETQQNIYHIQNTNVPKSLVGPSMFHELASVLYLNICDEQWVVQISSATRGQCDQAEELRMTEVFFPSHFFFNLNILLQYDLQKATYLFDFTFYNSVWWYFWSGRCQLANSLPHVNN